MPFTTLCCQNLFRWPRPLPDGKHPASKDSALQGLRPGLGRGPPPNPVPRPRHGCRLWLFSLSPLGGAK